MDILPRMLHELSVNRPFVVIAVSIGLGALLRSPVYLYYIIYTLVSFFTLLFVLLILNFTVSLLYHYLFAHGDRNDTRLHSNPLKIFQPLAFSTPSAWTNHQISRKREKTKIQRTPLSTDSLLISEEFDKIVSYIMRDFINSWFSKISDETVFSKAVEEVIREATFRVRDRLQKTDLLQVVVSRLLPLVTTHISDFRKAEVLLRGQALERAVTESDGLDLALAAKFRGGKFHPALLATAVSTVHTEVAYLKGLINRILPYVLPEKELGSNPLKILVREMVSCLMVQPVLQLLSDPDYWNQFIDTHLGKAIREQNMVNKLREALVKHAEELDVVPTRSFSAPNSSLLRPSVSTMSTLSTFSNDDIANDPDFDPEEGFIAPHYDRRSFEDFLRMIKDCQNLLDIKRIRADVVAQIRKKKAEIEGRMPDEVVNGELVEDAMRYINQLGIAKRKAEKRITQLSGGVERKGKIVERSVEDANTPVASLVEVLSSSVGISYFMEFMDRRGQMIRVQFWLTVEGFRGGPDREEDLSNDDIPEAEQEERRESKSKQDEAFRKDVRNIYNMYLAETAAPHRIQINPMLLTEIREFATNNISSFTNPEAATRARTSIFRAQEEIFHRMQKEDFPYFVHSDLYFKFLTTYQNSAPEGNTENLNRDGTQRKFRQAEKIFGSSSFASQKRRESLPAAWDSPKLKLPFSDIRRNGSWDYGEQGSRRSSSTDESISSSSLRRLNGHIKAASDSSVFNPEGVTSTSVQSADEDDENYEAMADSVTSLEEAEAPPARFVSRDTIEAVEAVLRSIMGGSWVSGGKGSEPTEEDTKSKKNLEYTSDSEGIAAVLKATGPGKELLMTSVDSQSNVPFGEDPSKVASESRIRRSSNDSESEIVPIWGDDQTAEESVSDIHTAPPGDLLLGTKIENLTEDIERITQQEAIVDALIVKAEATNRTNELRILKKSKSALRRELQGLIYQKSQYELQETENVLVPGRSTISIASSTVGRDHNKEFALYVIEVHQLAPDGTFAAGWIVTRRYSEFFALHQSLKKHYKFAKDFDLPGKRGLLRLQKGFVESRRVALEKYLQSLLANPEICGSQELRLFLSQQNVYLPPKYEEDSPLSLLLLKKPKSTVKPSTSATTQSSPTKNTRNVNDNVTSVPSKQKYINNLSLRRKKSAGYMKHIYKTVAEGIDDIFAGPSMLDVITQRLGEQVMQFSEDGDADLNGSGELESVSDSMAAAVEAAAQAVQTTAYPSVMTEGNKLVEHDRIARFTEPLCDLFIEVFELREKNNWLRRQAVQIILEQILGGKIERKLRETTKMLQAEDTILFALRRFTDAIWPGGVRPLNVLARTIEERQTTKDDANRKLSIWLPDILSNMVGRSNALRGARRIFTVFQNQRLNQQLLYELLDEVVVALFPEIRGEAVTREDPL